MVLLAPVEAMIHWFVTWNSFNFQRNFKSLKRKKKGQNISLKCHPNITWRLHRCCSVGKQNIPASFLWDVLMQGAGMKRMINFLGNIRRKMLCDCQFQIPHPPGQHGAFDPRKYKIPVCWTQIIMLFFPRRNRVYEHAGMKKVMETKMNPVI